MGELKATVATKDGEIKALEVKVADAAITPEKLQQMVDARTALVTVAKAVFPAIVTDGKTEAQIKREVVDSKLKDVTDAELDGAFKVLTADVKPASATVHNIGAALNVGDADRIAMDARAAMIAELKGEKPAQAA